MLMTRMTRSLVCLAPLLLAACVATRITDAWQSPSFQRKQLDKVLVVGVTGNKTNRILFEKGFVKELSSQGLQATASYDVIGGAMPTKDSVQEYLNRGDIRYVIVTRYGGTEVQKEYVPESVRTYYTGPYHPYYGGYWSHYGNTTTMTREAYVDTKTQVMLMTSIYEVKTGELVWVGRSKTFEVGSISFAADELAGQVIKHIGR